MPNSRCELDANSNGLRVLLVQDVTPALDSLKHHLQRARFAVTVSSFGDRLETKIGALAPDVLIIGWEQSDASGLALCQRLRCAGETQLLPIIVLTDQTAEAVSLKWFEAGADDYVTKPFSLPELTERSKALVRRSARHRLSKPLIVGDIQIDRSKWAAERNGRRLSLRPRELRLLKFLMRNCGRVMARSQILDGVWGHDAQIDHRTIDVHVGRLRRCLCLGGEADPIRAIRGEGYSIG